MANSFVVVGVGSSQWSTSGSWSSSTDFGGVVLSNTKTNLGFGFAYWYIMRTTTNASRAAEPDDYGVIMTDEVAAVMGQYANCKQYLLTRLQSNLSSRSCINFGSVFVPSNPNDEHYKLCNYGVSKQFNTPISVFEPKFPLYDFLDTGEVDIQFGKVTNGYIYEAGSRKGADGECNCFTTTGRLVQKRGDTNIKTINMSSLTDQAWSTQHFDVKAGDRIVFDIYKEPSVSTYYGILWFQRNLIGWKNADET